MTEQTPTGPDAEPDAPEDDGSTPAVDLRTLLPVVIGLAVLVVIGQTLRWMGRRANRRFSSRHPLGGLTEQAAIRRVRGLR